MNIWQQRIDEMVACGLSAYTKYWSDLSGPWPTEEPNAQDAIRAALQAAFKAAPVATQAEAREAGIREAETALQSAAEKMGFLSVEDVATVLRALLTEGEAR